MIAARNHARLELRPLQDHAGFGLVLRERDRLVEQRLVGHDAAGLDATARRQDERGLGIVDTGRQLAPRKAAEDDRMHRPDAGAGEHGKHRLRHHRHVDDNAVALLDAEVAQDGAQNLHLGPQPVIGDDALGAGEWGVVDQRRLRGASALDMAIDGVPAGVDDAVRKPAAIDTGLWVEHGLRGLVPVDLARGLAPESLRITLAAGIDIVITAGADIHGVSSALFWANLRYS